MSLYISNDRVNESELTRSANKAKTQLINVDALTYDRLKFICAKQEITMGKLVRSLLNKCYPEEVSPSKNATSNLNKSISVADFLKNNRNKNGAIK